MGLIRPGPGLLALLAERGWIQKRVYVSLRVVATLFSDQSFADYESTTQIDIGKIMNGYGLSNYNITVKGWDWADVLVSASL